MSYGVGEQWLLPAEYIPPSSEKHLLTSRSWVSALGGCIVHGSSGHGATATITLTVTLSTCAALWGLQRRDCNFLAAEMVGEVAVVTDVE